MKPLVTAGRFYLFFHQIFQKATVCFTFAYFGKNAACLKIVHVPKPSSNAVMYEVFALDVQQPSGFLAKAEILGV